MGDISFAGLSLPQVTIVIVTVMVSAIIYFTLANLSAVSPIGMIIFFSVLNLSVYLVLALNLINLIKNYRRYLKNKEHHRLGDLNNYQELSSINLTKVKNETVFIEHEPRPFETLTSTQRDKAAESWVSGVYHALEQGSHVTTYITTSKEDTEHLERRSRNLDTLSPESRENEKKRIDYHYTITKTATDTKYLQKIERQPDADEDMDEMLTLPGELVDGHLVGDYAKTQLLPNYIKKRGGEKEDAFKKVLPYDFKMKETSKYIEIEGHYMKSFLITDFPSYAYVNMLYDFTHKTPFVGIKKDSRSDISMTLFLKKSDLVFGNKQKTKMDRLQSSIKSANTGFESDVADPDEVATLDALKHIRDVDGDLVELSLLFTIISDDKKQFDKNCRNFSNYLKKNKGFIHDKLFLRQSDALSSAWYMGDDTLMKNNKGRIMPLSALASFYPFLDGTLSDLKGGYEGHRTRNNKASYTDHESTDNENIICVGPSGGGKSYKIKSKIKSLLNKGEKVYGFDIDGEYEIMVNELKGVYVDLTGDDSIYVDPTIIEHPLMDELKVNGLTEDEIRLVRSSDKKRYKEACLNTINTVRLLCTEWDTSNKMKNACAKALFKMYGDAGIDKTDESTWNKNPDKTTIHILYKEICDLAANVDSEYNTGAKELKSQLETYFYGVDAHILKRAVDSSWLKDNNLQVFKIGEAQDESKDNLAALRINMISPMIESQIKRDRMKKEIESAIFYDEYQRLRLMPAANKSVYHNMTTGRKFNLKVILGFNDPSFLFPDHAGIWTNAKHKWFFSIDANTIDNLSKAADMPDEIKTIWKNLGEYEFLLNKKIGTVDYYDTLKVRIPKSEEKQYETRGTNKVE